MPPSAVTLTLNYDLLTRKPNQYVSWRRYTCDLILVKLSPIVMKILYSPVFRVIACRDLYLWPWTSEYNQHIYEPKYICDQNWVKFSSLIFEIWCSQCFRDSQTHSWMDKPENNIPLTAKVFAGGGTKTSIKLVNNSFWPFILHNNCVFSFHHYIFIH